MTKTEIEVGFTVFPRRVSAFEFEVDTVKKVFKQSLVTVSDFKVGFFKKIVKTDQSGEIEDEIIKLFKKNFNHKIHLKKYHDKI